MSPGEASAYHEGRLAAVREQRDGGYVCPYRSGPRRAAWHRGLAAGRTECANLEHNRRVEAVPETEREANKAGMRSAIEEWLHKAKMGEAQEKPAAPACCYCGGPHDADACPTTFTPIVDCEHQDPDDGCCKHPKNQTPECHPGACPRLHRRIYDAWAAALPNTEISNDHHE